MHLFLSLSLAWIAPLAMAQTPITPAPAVATAPAPAPPQALIAPKALAVKEKPLEAARTLFYAQRGEKVWKMSVDKEYTRVKIKHNNKWIAGYIVTDDLEAAPEPEKPQKTLGNLAVGLGGVYSMLSQNGKTFETEDEVKYTVSKYSSKSFWPLIVGQWGREDFWQIHLGYRLTHFTGSAKQDNPGPVQTVDVESKMISVALSRVMTFGPAYVGLRTEFDRAIALKIKLGGVELPTTSEDFPNYFGLGAVVGAQGFVADNVSVYGDVRITAFVNQQMITAMEASAGAMVWF